MVIWRSGPSGAKVTKSGWLANSNGSSFRLWAGQFSRSATVSTFSARLMSSCSIRSGSGSRRAPNRRASVALPTPSGPEKSSVWANRSCAIICSSASVTCRFPQKRSNIGAHDVPDSLLDLFDAGAPVHQLHALRLAFRQSMIRRINLAMKLQRLLVHPGLAARLGGIAGACAVQAGFGIDIHQQREVRLEAAAGDSVERHHILGAQAASESLIYQRGIGEAIGDHHFAAVQSRQNPLIHVLRA